MKGLLVINKDSGISSSNVVVKVKKMLKIKKVGHMGTLDPLASGVLLVGVGKATRLFDEFLTKQKKYVATFKFGEQTDTLDLEGKVIKTCSFIPTQEDIVRILPKFVGKQNQLPPEYSSKKINGKRAYDLARNGEEVSLQPKQIEIFDINLLQQIDNNTFTFDILCSSGTYIRSIARDLGEKLNSCATMTKLVRSECSCFKLENAINLQEENGDSLKNKIIPLNEVLKDYKKIEISEKEKNNLLNGKIVKVLNKDKNIKYCLMHDNQIVGLCKVDSDDNLKITTFLYD